MVTSNKSTQIGLCVTVSTVGIQNSAAPAVKKQHAWSSILVVGLEMRTSSTHTYAAPSHCQPSVPARSHPHTLSHLVILTHSHTSSSSHTLTPRHLTHSHTTSPSPPHSPEQPASLLHGPPPLPFTAWGCRLLLLLLAWGGCTSPRGLS
jgi:hypothetical protein